MRRAIVAGLETVCGLLDAVPTWEDGRWYRYGDWGCRVGLSAWADRLDRRWHTGVWKAC